MMAHETTEKKTSTSSTNFTTGPELQIRPITSPLVVAGASGRACAEEKTLENKGFSLGGDQQK